MRANSSLRFVGISKKAIENNLLIKQQCGLEAKSIFQCPLSNLILAFKVSKVQCLNFEGARINHVIVTTK